ncbi:MAG: hypothetical protein JWM80_4396 [Cyanobacteria bacterium RYN_339]|nr:hypothetical protein [Cyanobacteria bacterium RYN_339]
MSRWHSLAATALAAWLVAALPAQAHLAESLTVRDAKDLEVVLQEVEDEAMTRGAPKRVVAGCTAKLANFIEDSVLTTGRVAVVHPPVLLALMLKRAAEGDDRAAIAERLLQQQKARKL